MGVILYFLSPLLPFSLKKTQRHLTFIFSPRKTAKKWLYYFRYGLRLGTLLIFLVLFLQAGLLVCFAWRDQWTIGTKLNWKHVCIFFIQVSLFLFKKKKKTLWNLLFKCAMYFPVHIHFMHSVFPFFIQQLNSVTSSSFMWQTKGLQKVVHFEGRYFSLSWEWRSCKLDWKSIRIRLTSFSTAFFLQGWSHTWREQETRSSHE